MTTIIESLTMFVLFTAAYAVFIFTVIAVIKALIFLAEKATAILTYIKPKIYSLANKIYYYFKYGNKHTNSAIKIQSLFRRYRARKYHRAQKATWAHGSNSHALFSTLKYEDRQLKSTGSLIAERKIPFSGELDKGVGVNGVNMKPSVSGVEITRTDGVCSLALSKHYAQTVSSTPVKALSKDCFSEYDHELRTPFETLVRYEYRAASNGTITRYQITITPPTPDAEKCFITEANAFYSSVRRYTILRSQYALLGKAKAVSPYEAIIKAQFESCLDNPLFAFNHDSIRILCELYDNPRLDTYEKVWARLPKGLQETAENLFNKGGFQHLKLAFDGSPMSEDVFQFTKDYYKSDTITNHLLSFALYAIMDSKYIDRRLYNSAFDKLRALQATYQNIVDDFYAPLPTPLAVEEIEKLSSLAIPVIFAAEVDIPQARQAGHAHEPGYHDRGQSELVINHKAIPLEIGKNIKCLITSKENKGQLIKQLQDADMNDKIWVYSFEEFETIKQTR